MNFQRDEFINVVYDAAQNDKSIFFLSADFGAPALDKFRKNLPEQFKHCGISEQHMVDLAVGLALDGNKVFCYAMAPFVSLRCLEQHKCGPSIMKLPICTIVAGVGFGYADAGPTHYATEDISCLRAMIDSNVYTASDPAIAAEIAKNLISNPKFSFVRLDREPSKNLNKISNQIDIENGNRQFFENNDNSKELLIITSGYMTGIIKNLIENEHLENKVSLLDLIICKPFPEIKNIISKFECILIIDEQTPYGGVSSAVLEYVCDKKIKIDIDRLTLPDKHFFDNGGRKHILSQAGLGSDDMLEKIKYILNI